ncbi:MAG: hypothetical protein ACC662_11305, partial [Planctomycetota bacterium]
MSSPTREMGIVLLDVERDEPSYPGDGVERVQEEPVVLQASPPGLDQGVREADLGLGQHAAQQTGRDHVIDGTIAVLDTAVGEERRRFAIGDEKATRFNQEIRRRTGVEAVVQSPGEDAPAEVVDDR